MEIHEILIDSIEFLWNSIDFHGILEKSMAYFQSMKQIGYLFELSLQHLKNGENWRNSRVDNPILVNQFCSYSNLTCISKGPSYFQSLKQIG